MWFLDYGTLNRVPSQQPRQLIGGTLSGSVTVLRRLWDVSAAEDLRPRRRGLGQGVLCTTVHLDPQSTSVKGLMVSIKWYLGWLKGQLGGAGR